LFDLEIFCRSQIDRRGRYRGRVVKENNYCNGSCILVLAAGKSRFAGRADEVRVQKLYAEEMPAIPNALKVSTAASAEITFKRDLGAYLDEMGINPNLMKYIYRGVNTPSYPMRADELFDLNVVTGRLHGSDLIENRACWVLPPASYCIRQ
jgi:hypothetical protein